MSAKARKPLQKKCTSSFSYPQKRGKSQCTRLCVNGALVSDPLQLLEVWTQHFQNLAQSQRESNPALEELFRQSTSLLSSSFQKDEVFLDVPFTSEEVEHAVRKMKLKKSAGQITYLLSTSDMEGTALLRG